MVNPTTKIDEPLKLPPVYRKIVVGCLLLSVLLAVVGLVSLSMGQGDIPLGTVLKSAAVKLHLISSTQKPAEWAEVIIWDMRLPRILLAALVGALLASAGVALQGLLLNPLADPYTVGVSSGAALGASIALAFGLETRFFGFGVPALAFVAAIGTMFLVYSLGRYRGRLAMHSFLLAGVVVGSFLWALVTFVMTVANQYPDRIIFWLLGSFDAMYPWQYVKIAGIFALFTIAALFALARDLNIFAMGEDTAHHLGVRTESLKNVIIAITSMATAAAVSVSGIIGFVGLIVPHTARRIFGPDHRVLLPTAALLGATLMVIADTVARNIMAGIELPVGVVTALLGAPFFCYLLKKGR